MNEGVVALLQRALTAISACFVHCISWQRRIFGVSLSIIFVCVKQICPSVRHMKQNQQIHVEFQSSRLASTPAIIMLASCT